MKRGPQHQDIEDYSDDEVKIVLSNDAPRGLSFFERLVQAAKSSTRFMIKTDQITEERDHEITTMESCPEKGLAAGSPASHHDLTILRLPFDILIKIFQLSSDSGRFPYQLRGVNKYFSDAVERMGILAYNNRQVEAHRYIVGPNNPAFIRQSTDIASLVNAHGSSENQRVLEILRELATALNTPYPGNVAVSNTSVHSFMTLERLIDRLHLLLLAEQSKDPISQTIQPGFVINRIPAGQPALWSETKRLNIHFNNLRSLPTDIDQMQKLVSLNMGNNQLMSLPQQVANLSSLTALDLNNNELAEFPQAVLALTGLTQLRLDGNRLKNLPPEIGNLTNIQELNLGHNQLFNLPKELTRLPHTATIRLEKNYLSELSIAFTSMYAPGPFRCSKEELLSSQKKGKPEPANALASTPALVA